MKKRLTIFLMILLVVMSSMGLSPLHVQAAYVFSGGGDGTAEDPYLIHTAEDLDHIRDNLTASYKLQADIDLSAYGNWQPIGSDAQRFDGNFDGAGYTISEMTIQSSANSIGLFGVVGKDAMIKNVRLNDVDITATGVAANVGGLVGVSFGTIEHCSVAGKIDAVSYAAGGLAGQVSSSGTSVALVSNSDAHVRLDAGYTWAGGLVGVMSSNATIEQSYATGDVSSTRTAGGLVGWLGTRMIRNSYATGHIAAGSGGNTSIGGLVGYATIGQLENSYAAGILTTGTGSGGGLVGKKDNMGTITITSSYWNVSSNPTLNTVGGAAGNIEGVSQTEMTQMATYDDWDTTIWGIQEGVSYPYVNTFYPTLRVDSLSSTYSTEPGNNQLTISGYVRDGSIGEPLEVSYTILDAVDRIVAQDMYAVDATGDDQGFNLSTILDKSNYPLGTYTIDITVSDTVSGHEQTQSLQFDVVDTAAPVLTLNGSNPMQVEVGSTFTDPGATALDTVEGDITAQITVSGTVDANQIGTYTLTYQVSDTSGNTASTTRTVNVVDSGAPVLTLVGSNPMRVVVGSTFTDPGATAHDAVDGDVTAQITVSGTVNTNQVGTYTLTYQVSDTSGNTATQIRTVKVVDNGGPVITPSPVITLIGSNPMEVEAGSSFTDPGATAQDAVDGDLTAQITVSGKVNTNQVGTYTLTYEVSNASGKTASVIRTVNVTDSVAPVITLIGSNPMEVVVGSTFTDPGATAEDEMDGDVTDQITVSGTVDAHQVDTYTLTYEVSDTSGNTASTTRTVNVVDIGAPVITIKGSNPMEVEAGSRFTDPGATAEDEVDGDLTDQITVSGKVNAKRVGTYTLTYQVSNASGKTAFATRTVNVVDSEGPVITLLGSKRMEVELGSTFTDPGVTAEDEVDGDVTDRITVSGTVNANQVGTYTLVYKVLDRSGNKAKDVVRTVKVIKQKSSDSGGRHSDRGHSDRQSSDADLAKLNISSSDQTLGVSPAFSPKTTEYTAQTDAEQVQMELVPDHSKAIVKLDGERIRKTKTVPLEMGANRLVITVQAEDGTIKTYTITIHRIAETTVPSMQECPFTDIENHWGKRDICEAAELGIVKGVAADTFAPYKYVTRTEFAVLLMRTLQIEADYESSAVLYRDEASIPEWARLTIQTAVARGILEGYSDGTLRPMQTITRSEMAAMVSKAMKWKSDNWESTTFADDERIPAWAKAYVEANRERGIVTGQEGNRFVPDGVTTRAEAAVVLLRLWKTLY